MKEDKIDGACSSHERDEKRKQYFGWITEGKRIFERPRFRCEDNIRMHLRETGSEGADQWRVLVNTVIKLPSP
jgi:hypothetical protein